MIGPMTNLALAYHYNNEIVNCFSTIVSMSCTNTLTGMCSFFSAEFNAALDP
jgi:inosine-uridine nucleoside N-ribohydrolase